jgi:hypothetical protein
MSQDDPRAFRSHLAGRDLYRAQERLIAAILRAPSLSSVIRVASLSRHHLPSELATVFDFALRSDRDGIRRAVQNGIVDVGRLFRLGVELSHAQVLQLARQIKESVERERPLRTEAPDADDRVDDIMPMLNTSPSAPVGAVSENSNAARAGDIDAAPAIVQRERPPETEATANLAPQAPVAQPTEIFVLPASAAKPTENFGRQTPAPKASAPKPPTPKTAAPRTPPAKASAPKSPTPKSSAPKTSAPKTPTPKARAPK